VHRDMAYGEPEPGSSSVPARMGFRFPSGQDAYHFHEGSRLHSSKVLLRVSLCV